jgi:polyisoprenoid-binding protein YceI
LSVSTSVSGVWESDPVHSSFGFAVRHMSVSWYRGVFEDVHVTLDADASPPTLSGTAQVQSISIRGPEALRNHVLSDEFFDAENHPELSFTSSNVSLNDDGTAAVEGELTLRGTAKPVSATGSWEGPVETFGGPRISLELTATLDRGDWGLDWNAPLSGGGEALGREVALTLSLEMGPKE